MTNVSPISSVMPPRLEIGEDAFCYKFLALLPVVGVISGLINESAIQNLLLSPSLTDQHRIQLLKLRGQYILFAVIRELVTIILYCLVGILGWAISAQVIPTVLIISAAMGYHIYRYCKHKEQLNQFISSI